MIYATDHSYEIEMDHASNVECIFSTIKALLGVFGYLIEIRTVFYNYCDEDIL